MSAPPGEITELLVRWSRGEREALDRLMPLVEGELRQLARRHMRGEPAGHTLQPTALVNELYLRCAERRRLTWQCRAQFFAFAGQTLRRILIDHARGRRADKRGGGARLLTLDKALGVSVRPDVDLLALDQALGALAELDARQARLAELRLFAGLTISEAAHVLGVSEATVNRDWGSATAWLYRELTRATPPAA